MSWRSMLLGDGTRHVVPIDDLRPHELGLACWCRPVIDDEPPPEVIVHNSMDGRESFERGERRPS